MKLKFIKEQIEWVDAWTSNLIKDVREDELRLVDALGTSLNWQIGHILISKYFHSIQSILKKDHAVIIDVNQRVPIDDFFKNYFAGSNPRDEWKARPNKVQLIEYKEEMDLATMQVLEGLAEKELKEAIELPNPVAKTKYDALTFTFKHQMWHNGQIALINRVIREGNSIV